MYQTSGENLEDDESEQTSTPDFKMKTYKTQKYVHIIPFSWTPITADKSPMELFQGENPDSEDNKSVK